MIRARGINGKKVKLHTTARSKIVPVLLSTVYHIPEVFRVTLMRKCSERIFNDVQTYLYPKTVRNPVITPKR